MASKKNTEKKKGIPKDEQLIRVAPPDVAKFKVRLDEVDLKIAALKKKEEALQKKIQEKSHGKDEFIQKKLQLRSQVDAISSKMDALAKMKESVGQGLESRKKEEAGMKDEYNKMKRSMQFTSVEAIDKRIEDINYKIMVETMTMKDEKALLAELKDLKKCKPKIAQLSKMETSIQSLDSTVEHRQNIKNLNEELYLCRQEKRGVLEEIKKLQEERDLKMGDVSSVYDEKKQLYEEIQALNAEKKQIRDQQYDEKRAFDQFKQEERRVRAEKRQAENDKRKVEQQQLKRQARADELDEQPHVAETTLIEQTILWCKSLIATKVEEVQAEKKEISHDIPEGGAVLLSKKDRDEEFFFAPIKKKKKQAGKAQKKPDTGSKPIKHNAETFRQFDDLKLDAPLSTADIPFTLNQLQGKLLEYQEKVAVWKVERASLKAKILAGELDEEEEEKN